MRRFTRLTNAFSKKVYNHAAAVALYAVWYNWVRPHGSLKGKTPAMAAGLAREPRSMAWLAGLAAPRPRRLYPVGALQYEGAS